MKKLSLLLAVLAIASVGTLAGAELRIERNLKLEPNGRFLLELDVGSVTLTGVASSGAKIVITSERSDLESLYTITFQENPWHARGLRPAARIAVASAFLTGATVLASTSRSRSPPKRKPTYGLAAEAWRFRTCAATPGWRTSGGLIGVSALTGRLDAATSGGPIRLREITGDTRIDTSGGPIVVESLEVRSTLTPAAAQFTLTASPDTSRLELPAGQFP